MIAPFVFQKPGDPARSALILDVNPRAPTRASVFDPKASYERKVDTDGDAEAEIAFRVPFAPVGDRQEPATLWRATGRVGGAVIRDAPSASTARCVPRPRVGTGSTPDCAASPGSSTWLA